MTLLDELVRTAAARGSALELRRSKNGRTIARIAATTGIGVSPNRALEALAAALGTPAVLRLVSPAPQSKEQPRV